MVQNSGRGKLWQNDCHSPIFTKLNFSFAKVAKCQMFKGLYKVLKPCNTIVNNLYNHAYVHMQYVLRWHHLYSQASKQSSNTDVINQQVIVDSTSNATVYFSGKQSYNVLMQVDVSDSIMHL